MAKGCCGAQCACKVSIHADSQGNDSIDVQGTGTQQDPFVFRVAGLNPVSDPDILLTIGFTEFDDVGNGGSYNIKASLAGSSKLDHLGDVVATAPTNGQVLAWNSTTHAWQPVAPTTASSGAVANDNSLNGDGSVGSPLSVAHSAGRRTATFTDGIGLTDVALNEIVRHYTDATGRSADAVTPVMNALSALDSAPGDVDYWNGTDWVPFLKIDDIVATEVLALSGSYDDRPATLFIKQIATSTDSTGVFDLLTTSDLAGYAGVLSVQFQQMVISSSDLSFHCRLVLNTDSVQGQLWDPDSSAGVSTTPVAGTVTAYLY